MFLTKDLPAYKQKYDVGYQLGAYYDMCYKRYFTRIRFILGLSEYNEDDTVRVREEEVIMKPFEKYDRIDRTNYWNAFRKLDNDKEDNKERDYYDVKCPVYHALNEMAIHIHKESPFDKVIHEILLHTYPDMDEQEFQVCKAVIWVIWDLSSGRNQAYYQAVIEYLLDPQKENRRDLFTTIKDVEDTILRLVHKGILSQYIEVRGIADKNRNTRWIFDEPFICLSFIKESDAGEAIGAMGEAFSQEVQAFVGPITNYDV